MLWLSTAPRCLGLSMPATAPSLATAATQASKLRTVLEQQADRVARAHP
jgi:hypothetical protein